MLRSFRDMGDDRTPLEWLMTSNLMDKRNELLSYPLRKAGPYLSKVIEKDSGASTVSQLSAMALLAIAAAPTFGGNILMPANLIAAGLRPAPVVEGITFARHSPYVKPLWNVFHGASPAYKAGARVGGKVGGRIGARLIPGVGWALLAYDVYDVAVNRSLWGFDL